MDIQPNVMRAASREVEAMDAETARTLVVVSVGALAFLAAVYIAEQLTYWAFFGEPKPGREYGVLLSPSFPASRAYPVELPCSYSVVICPEWSNAYRRNLRHPLVCARQA